MIKLLFTRRGTFDRQRWNDNLPPWTFPEPIRIQELDTTSSLISKDIIKRFGLKDLMSIYGFKMEEDHNLNYVLVPKDHPSEVVCGGEDRNLPGMWGLINSMRKINNSLSDLNEAVDTLNNIGKVYKNIHVKDDDIVVTMTDTGEDISVNEVIKFWRDNHPK